MAGENTTKFITNYVNQLDKKKPLLSIITADNVEGMIRGFGEMIKDFPKNPELIDEVVDELNDRHAHGNQFLTLKEAAAKRAIELVIKNKQVDLVDFGGFGELKNMADVKNNNDLFAIFSKLTQFKKFHLEKKNFSEDFYTKVALLAKGGVERLVNDAAQLVIEIAINHEGLDDLVDLCGAKKNDAELDLEIKRYLHEIQSPPGDDEEEEEEEEEERPKLVTNEFPSESLDLVVKKVREQVIQRLVETARAKKIRNEDENVDEDAPAVGAELDDHNNYIDTLSINQCVERIKASIGPDLVSGARFGPLGTSLKNDLAVAKRELGDKTVSDYKKAKERIAINAGTLGRYRVHITDEAETVINYEALQKAQRKLYLATEQLQRVERHLSLVEAADKTLELFQNGKAFEEGDDQLKLILEQTSFITESIRIAREAAKILVPSTLDAAVAVNPDHPATTGYVVNSFPVLKTTTCKLSDVIDLRAEAQVKINSLLKNAPRARAVSGLETVNEDSEPAFYQNMRLEDKEHKLTTAYLNNNRGVLLLAQDSKGTIRDFSTASTRPSSSDLAAWNQYRQDVFNKAFIHAQERLDNYNGKLIYILTPEGESHDAEAANRLYAALLLVAESRGIKNMKIESRVHGHDVPADGYLYGKDNKTFIDTHLLNPFGNTNASTKERLIKDKENYTLFIKGKKTEDKPMHGDTTEPPKPKWSPFG